MHAYDVPDDPRLAILSHHDYFHTNPLPSARRRITLRSGFGLGICLGMLLLLPGEMQATGPREKLRSYRSLDARSLLGMAAPGGHLSGVSGGAGPESSEETSEVCFLGSPSMNSALLSAQQPPVVMAIPNSLVVPKNEPRRFSSGGPSGVRLWVPDNPALRSAAHDNPAHPERRPGRWDRGRERASTEPEHHFLVRVLRVHGRLSPHGGVLRHSRGPPHSRSRHGFRLSALVPEPGFL